MLANVYRDFATLPEAQQQALRDQGDRHREALEAPFRRICDQRRRRGVIGHAISFRTWHSLCAEQGLTDQEAVEVMTGMVLAATRSPDAGPDRSGTTADPSLQQAATHQIGCSVTVTPGAACHAQIAKRALLEDHEPQ